MGLDQLAYSRPATATNDETDEHIVSWCKHPNLQGWMERLWRKQKYGSIEAPDPKTGEGCEAEAKYQLSKEEVETAIAVSYTHLTLPTSDLV